MRYLVSRTEWVKVHTTQKYSLVQSEGGDIRLSTIPVTDPLSSDGILLSSGSIVYVNSGVDLYVIAKFANSYINIQEQAESRIPELVTGKIPVIMDTLSIANLSTTIDNTVDVIVKNTETFPVSVTGFYTTKVILNEDGDLIEEWESNGVLNRKRTWSYSLEGTNTISIATEWSYT
jgi:hypothetical protein